MTRKAVQPAVTQNIIGVYLIKQERVSQATYFEGPTSSTQQRASAVRLRYHCNCI